METNKDGFIIIFHGVFPSIRLTQGTGSGWKTRVTNAIVQATIGQLIGRLVDPDDKESCENVQGRKGTRKALFGIGTATDTFATTGLIAGTVAPLLKKHTKILKEAGSR